MTNIPASAPTAARIVRTAAQRPGLTPAHFQHPSQREALEARFALRMSAALTEAGVHPDIEERLRVSRQAAVLRARQARVAVASGVSSNGQGSATLSGPPWWLRLASFAPLMVLALGLMLISHIDDEERIQAAAEIDAVLLADELPPRAYTDPGFAEYLRQPTP